MEENKSSQFVVMPKKDVLLQKYEILIYVCIRRYMNQTTMEAFPALDTIVRDSGCSKPTVIKTIEVIEQKGYFKRIPKSKSKSKVRGKGCVYVFNNDKHFEPFSYDFLDNATLSKSEKLQILCTQQYMYLDEANQSGKISYSDRELSEKTGLDYRTIKKNNNSLIDKGYANQVTLQTKDPVTGIVNKETIYHLDKFGQSIVFALRNHEQRICNTEDAVQELQKEVAELKEIVKSKTKDYELIYRENRRLNKIIKESSVKDAIVLEF